MCGEGGNLSTRDLGFIYVSSAGRVGCEFIHPAQPADAPSSRRSSLSHFYTLGFPRSCKENKRNISFQRDIYNPSTVYQPGTYMSLAQSKNKHRLIFFLRIFMFIMKKIICKGPFNDYSCSVWVQSNI